MNQVLKTSEHKFRLPKVIVHFSVSVYLYKANGEIICVCVCVFLCLPLQELGMKQPLHRKKLQLALQALGSDEDDLKGKLDHNWVTSECVTSSKQSNHNNCH